MVRTALFRLSWASFAVRPATNHPPGGPNARTADPIDPLARPSGRGGLAGAGLNRRRPDARAGRAALLRYGPNRLDEAKPASVWQRVLRHLNNVLLYVLIAAALVTGLMGHWVDTFVIIAVVVLNVAIGFVQEGKAEKALQAIRHLLAPHAVVLRDGRQQDIDAADLVPGDVVLLASGDSLPADVRLLQARSLRIDEAALTGESVPVDKQVDAVADDAAIGDRICMGYAGTPSPRARRGPWWLPPAPPPRSAVSAACSKRWSRAPRRCCERCRTSAAS